MPSTCAYVPRVKSTIPELRLKYGRNSVDVTSCFPSVIFDLCIAKLRALVVVVFLFFLGVEVEMSKNGF